ncbi:MAG: hypothetical protein ACP5N7_04905 [Candidatus Pacearchaeota archaeon]
MANEIHNHQYFFFEDFQTSAKAFYDSLKLLIEKQQFPEVKVETKELSEGGMFSAKREYLWIKHKDLEFYICAAPFGTNFFISWWLKDTPDMIPGILSGKSNKKTLFQVDKELIFLESIRAAIKHAVSAVTQTNGLRTRTPDELIAKNI